MRWPHYEHIFFDCDSTLTTVEGIDILAESAGKRWRVEVLTQAAMDGELDLEDIFARRLRAVKPTHQQIRDIRRAYKRHMVQDAKPLIAALQELGHQVYIISGGLLEPVREFGVFLGVPPEQIRAVDITYDELSGQWWLEGSEQYLDYEEGALTVSDGKAEIVQELLEGKNGRSLLVGDGYSDLLAGRAVNLFAGFGGVVQRQRVMQQAPLFVQSASLAPLLVIAAGPAAIRRLIGTPHEALSRRALELIHAGAIRFNDERLNAKFSAAFDAVYQAFHTRPGGDALADADDPDATDE